MFGIFKKPAKKSANKFTVEHADLLGNQNWCMQHISRLETAMLNQMERIAALEAKQVREK